MPTPMPAISLPSPLESDAAHQGFFAKCAVVVVHEQQARSGIAGDEDVGPAVVVRVECCGGEAVGAVQRADAGFF